MGPFSFWMALIDFVTDDEIIEAYKLLASTEGILAEPGSAASIAGLIKFNKASKIESGKTITCVLTGNGLKDPDSAINYSDCEIKKTSSNLGDIAKIINL